ncbi:MAG TPA: YbgF trimerization domain-containing protein, partial [Casimicrobiaceae bacterium]
MKATLRTCALGIALTLAAHAANAAIFPDDEARRRIEDTNIRLSQLQRQIEDRLAAMDQQLKSGGIADLANQMQVLQSEIAKLRGQVEVVTYELEQSQKRQRDLYVDLDTRMRKLESAAAAAAAEKAAAANAANANGGENATAPPSANAAPPGSAATPPNAPPAAAMPPPGPVAALPPVRNSQDGVAEQRAYDAALDLFKRGDYGGAITAFSSFVKTYPRSQLASSAQFWLGSAQYAKRDYRGSIATQRQLL